MYKEQKHLQMASRASSCICRGIALWIVGVVGMYQEQLSNELLLSLLSAALNGRACTSFL